MKLTYLLVSPGVMGISSTIVGAWNSSPGLALPKSRIDRSDPPAGGSSSWVVFGEDAAVLGFCFGEGFFDIVAMPFSFRGSDFVVVAGPADGTGFLSAAGGAGVGGLSAGGKLVRGGFGDGEGGMEGVVSGARRGGADGWCCCDELRES